MRLPSCFLFCVIFETDNRDLLDFFPVRAPLQSENHIGGTLKETDILFPTHAALTVLQADKLLLHFSAAVWAYLVAGTHTRGQTLFTKINAQSLRNFLRRLPGFLSLL